jgi:hypothetical protein
MENILDSSPLNADIYPHRIHWLQRCHLQHQSACLEQRRILAVANRRVGASWTYSRPKALSSKNQGFCWLGCSSLPDFHRSYLGLLLSEVSTSSRSSKKHD